LSSYLGERTQIVKINNIFSRPSQINKGVPQGSILGPILFLFYINDFPAYIENISIPILYADDTTLTIYGKDIDQIAIASDSCLDEANRWFISNDLTINKLKTENLLCSLNQNIIKANTNNSVKMLGIHIDPKLKWDVHITQLAKSLAKNLFILRRVRNYISFKCLKSVYFALVHSLISYGTILWGNSS